MPKLIPELKEKLIAAARKRLLQSETHDFSTRQLAEDCGIASGTLFNYFSSKEELLACVMLEDWKQILNHLYAFSREAESVADGFKGMERSIRSFSDRFRPVWTGYTRNVPISRYHGQLIRQIREPVKALLNRFCCSAEETELSVISEMLLACSMREEDTIDRILPVMHKIID